MPHTAITIDVAHLYADHGQAKLAMVDSYEAACLDMAGMGNDIILTGPGPIWLYLRLAHALHGKARSLGYDSPVTGVVGVFNHNPY